MIRRLAFLFSVVILTVLTSNIAQAQYPYGSDLAAWNGWGGQGYGYLGTRVGYAPLPPYFAIHPPVYYSAKIIRRPYGASPFAWPSTYPPFTTTEIESRSVSNSDPAFFFNPYLKQEDGGGQLPPPRRAPASGDQSRSQPLLIINPYVISQAVAAK